MQNLLKLNPITQLQGVYYHRLMTYSWSAAYKINIRTRINVLNTIQTNSKSNFTPANPSL